MNINLRISFDSDATDILHRILAGVERLERKQETIMADLTALQAEVERNTTVENSALALIQGLAAQITAAGTDPVKLKAITDQLTSNDDALAAAVAANTPAA